jgi:hypothetical protein
MNSSPATHAAWADMYTRARCSTAAICVARIHAQTRGVARSSFVAA